MISIQRKKKWVREHNLWQRSRYRTSAGVLPGKEGLGRYGTPLQEAGVLNFLGRLAKKRKTRRSEVQEI